MFGSEKKKPPENGPSLSHQMRETLYADMPWEQCAKLGGAGPWNDFWRARQALNNHDRATAVGILRGMLNTPSESRITLQIWHFLRELDLRPLPAEAKHVYGVVVEVGMPEGLDVLASYEDGAARYWNYSGSGVVWESNPDQEVNAAIKELLARGQAVALLIGPGEGPRPPAVQSGQARISMLTPSGIHFGQARMEDLANDSKGGPVFHAAANLMQVLMAKASAARKGREGEKGGGAT